MIPAQSLLDVMGGELLSGPARNETVLRSPGLLARHYAPKAKLVLWHWRDENELAARLEQVKLPREKIHVIAHAVIPLREKLGRVAVIPHDAEAFARALYAELHQCDEEGAGLIVVEAPPEGESWAAITDRLTRAAS
jgi:L-threonylcarbamoyladenylate synthase